MAPSSSPSIPCGGSWTWRKVLPSIDAVLLLTALRDDEPIPTLALPLTAFESGGDWGHPQLTQVDLDREFAAKLVRADQRWEEIWSDHVWADSSERGRPESRRSRRRPAPSHQRSRREGQATTSGSLSITSATPCGRRRGGPWKPAIGRGRSKRWLPHARRRKKPHPPSKLYEVSLSAQYESSPASLGAMGETLSDFETWLMSPKAE